MPSPRPEVLIFSDSPKACGLSSVNFGKIYWPGREQLSSAGHGSPLHCKTSHSDPRKNQHGKFSSKHFMLISVLDLFS